MKLKNMAKVERIDKEKVKYNCQKCTYQFIYNINTKMPNKCSYCGSGIAKFEI